METDTVNCTLYITSSTENSNKRAEDTHTHTKKYAADTHKEFEEGIVMGGIQRTARLALLEYYSACFFFVCLSHSLVNI